MRHAVFAHGDLNFHSGIVNLAQHLFDAPNGLTIKRGWFSQFDHYNLPQLSSADRIFRDQDVLSVTLVLGRNQKYPRLIEQPPNDGIGCTFNDLCDPPLGASPTICTRDFSPHAITVQHRAHLVGW